MRIIHNKLLAGWFIVIGPHQTPVSGRFASRGEAQAWLRAKAAIREQRGEDMRSEAQWGTSGGNEP